MDPAALVLVGALLSAIGGFWATARQQRLTAEAAEQRAQFERELRMKSDEIASLNRQIAASITGGDGFTYLDVIPEGDGFALLLLNGSEFPAYDVSIRIVDVDTLNRLGRQMAASAAFARSQLVVGAGNVGPKQVALIGRLPDKWSDIAAFNVFIGARNGFVTELLRRRKVDGEWHRAIRVTRDRDGAILYERVDPKFPRNAQGEVDWGS